MEKVLKVVKLCLMLGLISVILLTCRLLFRLNTTLSQTQADIQQASEELHGTSQNLNAFLIQAGLTADEARRAAIEQRAYWRRNSAETHEVLINANKLLVNLDKVAVVDGMELYDVIGKTGEGLNQNLTSLNHSILTIGNAADDLDRVLLHSDQMLYQSGDQVQQTMQNVSDATKSLANASKDVEVKVHQLTRPAKWWMSVGGAVLSTGAQVGQWILGYFK